MVLCTVTQYLIAEARRNEINELIISQTHGIFYPRQVCDQDAYYIDLCSHSTRTPRSKTFNRLNNYYYIILCNYECKPFSM